MLQVTVNRRQGRGHGIWWFGCALLLVATVILSATLPHLAQADETTTPGTPTPSPSSTTTYSPGWNERNGDWYYADDQGHLVTGWISYKSRWYCCDTQGRMLTGIIDDGSGKRYVTDEYGAMRTDAWVKSGQHWVYATSSGALVMNSWYHVGGQWYHFDEQGYMQIGIYKDGKGIAYYLDDTGAMRVGWIWTSNGWIYADDNGALTNTFLWWKGHWYCFDKNTYLMKKWVSTHPDYPDKAFYCDGSGALQYGWSYTAAGWVYADQKGYLVRGWQSIDGAWYLFNDEYMMRTGVVQDAAQKWYCLTSSGAMATGWVKTDQGWVYAQPSGELYAGLHRIDGASYYFKTAGAPLMQTGIIEIDGKRYGAAPSGALVAQAIIKSGADVYGTNEHCQITTGWFKEGSGARYYLNPADQGRAVRGMKTIDGKQFFFDTNTCALKTNTVATDGTRTWYVNATGEAFCELRKLSSGKYQALTIDGKPYPAGFITAIGNRLYVDDDGALHTGWLSVDGSRYYCDETGLVAIGWKQINSSWYFFGDAGKMKTGWVQDNNTWYFLNKDGVMQTGWIQDKGVWYHTDQYGGLQIGWIQDKGVWYHTDQYGGMQTGWVTVDGTSYYFAPSGAWVSDTSDMGTRAQSYSSPTNYLIMVDVDNKYVGVYSGHTGAWNLVKRFRCTVGDYNHQTPRGTFSILSRGYSFSTSWCTCYYYLQYYGDYLFHSPPELFSGGTLSAMGTEGSHGCVRVEKFNAKWLYETIPTGTTVITY